MNISSLNLSKINNAVGNITDTVSKSKLLIENINKKVSESNERIRTRISNSAKLFQRRQQAVRRRIREDLIEASGIGGALRRANKIVSSSTRGFLGRILDFVGTILVGWAIVNIPKIVDGVEKLMKRLQKFFNIITGFTTKLTEIFTKFSSELSGIFSNLLQVDFSQISEKMTTIMTRLQKSFQRMENGFIREVLGFSKMNDEDLVKYFQEDIDKEIKDAVDKNVAEQVDTQSFEELSPELQNAVKLLMTKREDLKLEKYEIDLIESKNTKKLINVLKEKGVVPIIQDDGTIEYALRENSNDMMEDAANFARKTFLGDFMPITEEMKKDMERIENKVDKLSDQKIEEQVDNYVKDRNLVSEDNNKTTVYIKNRKNIQNRSSSKGEETKLNSSSVNSNNFLRDLFIQKVKE
mgnify:CR=1 FL=1|tara:strand:+ start:1444 stop:2673 length:1230 start_codon:yes stop_codon:yes gene_type:complete